MIFVLQRDIISVHIGQAGCQIGVSCWELYCLEHGVDSCGYSVTMQEDLRPIDDNYATFFHETENGKHVPRTIFIDLEPSVIGNVDRVMFLISKIANGYVEMLTLQTM